MIEHIYYKTYYLLLFVIIYLLFIYLLFIIQLFIVQLLFIISTALPNHNLLFFIFFFNFCNTNR